MRSFSIAAALLGGLALFAGASQADAASARTIFHNGKVFTADPQNPWAQAIAVHGKKIAEVGDSATLLAHAGPDTRLVDLGGRTVVPGLNDAHAHMLGSQGVPLNFPDFVPADGPTYDEVLDLVAAGAASTPPGTWLVVYVGAAITDDPAVDRFGLDGVAPDHPVRLEGWTGHGMYLNTKAMVTLGIAETEPDPFGGFFERVPNTDILSGEVHEYAEHLVRRRMFATRSDADLAGQYAAFAGAAVQLGFTSVQDMAVGLPAERTLDVLAMADLPLRVRSICVPLTLDESCAAGSDDDDDDGSAWITASGMKWITDGTPIERFAFLNGEYADRPGESGTFNFEEAPLLAMMQRGKHGSKKKNQLLFHAVGDGAIENVLDALAATGGAHAWDKRRPRIEHGDLLFPDRIPQAAELGVVIVQNARHLALPNIFGARLTPAEFAEIQPLRTLLDAGVPLALGTDAIGFPASPWLDVFLAAIHPDRPSEAITVEQAVTAYTLGAAYAEMQEKKKGSLVPGKLADLAVLSQDVFTVPVFAVPGTSSVLTVVGGEVVFDAGIVVVPP